MLLNKETSNKEIRLFYKLKRDFFQVVAMSVLL